MKQMIRGLGILSVSLFFLCLILVVPAIGEVSILHDDLNCTGNTLILDLSSTNPTLQLNTVLSSGDDEQSVIWQSSKKSIATVSESGLVTGLKQGTVTITAISEMEPKDTASCKVKVTNLAKQLNITGNKGVVGGKKTTLKVEVLPKETSNRKVTWESSDPEIAAVSSKGVVTAAKTDEAKKVTITATALDGSGVTAAYQFTVYPAVEEVTILQSGADFASEVILIDLASGTNTIQFDAAILPSDAYNGVTWKSSKKSIATVSENGLVTGLKIGTTTITATSTDGTKCKAVCNVTVTRLAKEIEISGDDPVVGGTVITLKAVVLPEDTANQKINWASSDTDVATVSSKGIVNTGVTNEAKTVMITATAADGSGVTNSWVITVLPAVQDISIQYNGVDYTTDKLVFDLALGVDTLQLKAIITPVGANQAVTWKSSDENIATVSEDGLVTALNRGSVTITATSDESENAVGPTVKSDCKIMITCLAKEVIITGPETVVSGTSATYYAEVLPKEVGDVTIAWGLSNFEIASINEMGVLTVNEITEEQTLVISASVRDGSEVYSILEITLLPAD